MNLHSIHSIVSKIQFRNVFLVVASIVFNFCAEEPQLWKVDSQQQVMGNYISNNPDQFSEFDKLIKTTGIGSLLNTRGPFTLFLPNDEAIDPMGDGVHQTTNSPDDRKRSVALAVELIEPTWLVPGRHEEQIRPCLDQVRERLVVSNPRTQVRGLRAEIGKEALRP